MGTECAQSVGADLCVRPGGASNPEITGSCDKPMNEQQPQRKLLRLQEYDYSQPGIYFVTICTEGKECLFGRVEDDKVHLNAFGEMVRKWWLEAEKKFRTIKLDGFIVMPSHIHALIQILPAEARPGPDGAQTVGADAHVRPHDASAVVGADLRVRPRPSPDQGACPSLPRIVQWFKTMSTNEYIRNVKESHWPQFKNRLWQRNYYEHVVRNEQDLHEIREYIVYNASKWESDQENPTYKPHSPNGGAVVQDRVSPHPDGHIGPPLRREQDNKYG